MCTDYDKIHFETRDHCVEDCIKGMFSATDQDIAIHQLLYTSKEWTENPNLRIVDIEFNRSLLLEYYDSCYGKCPLGCHTLYYEPEMRHKGSYMKYSYTFSLDSVNLMRKLVFSPKFDTLSYMIFLASVCSLWFGFVIYDSFIGSIPVAMDRFKRRVNHSHHNVNQVKISNVQVNVIEKDHSSHGNRLNHYNRAVMRASLMRPSANSIPATKS